MSTKTLRVCDRVDEGKACDRPYKLTCVLCDTDVCTSHATDNTVDVEIHFGQTRMDHVGIAPLCLRCSRLSQDVFKGVASTLFKAQTDEIITALKAAVAARALAAEPKP